MQNDEWKLRIACMEVIDELLVENRDPMNESNENNSSFDTELWV